MQEYTEHTKCNDATVTDDVRARFIQAMRWLNDPRSYLAYGTAAGHDTARSFRGRRGSRPVSPWPTCIRIVTAA